MGTGLTIDEIFAMSATVHRLFPGGGKENPPKSADGSVMATNPLVDALRAACMPILLTQLQAMFEGADDTLFGISQRAGVSDDQNSAFDTMRLLRLQRNNIAAEFERAFAGSFQPAADSLVDEFDLDRLAVMPTEELEEKIAIGMLVSKAENLHQELLREISVRITHMIRDLGIPVSRQALTPAVICNAFRASIATLDLPLSARLMLYKLFDRCCTSMLDTVYQPVLKKMDSLNIRAPAPQGDVAAPSWSPFDAPPVPTEPGEPLSIPVLDNATLQALEEISTQSAGHRPQDASFAKELLGLSRIDSAAEATVKRVAPSQRLSLVGQMCNEILSDPHLPTGMRPLFERLRFPLVKIALADGSFFSNRIHPVRRLVAEAAETAAASRVTSHSVVRRLEERLRHIADQIDLSATFVRPQIAYLQPLLMPEIASFLDQQREESETRRENVLNKVRRTVAQELEVHTLGRKPVPALINFLRVGWGPLMAARLLRHGMNSREWIEAITRLTQVLSSVGIVETTPEVSAQREAMCASITLELRDIGMREDRNESALGYLRRAFVEAEERLAAMSPEDRVSAEFELLSPMEAAAVLAEFPAPATARGAAAPPKDDAPQFIAGFEPGAPSAPRVPPPTATPDKPPPAVKLEVPPGTKPLAVDVGIAAALAMNAASAASAASVAAATSAASAASSAAAAAQVIEAKVSTKGAKSAPDAQAPAPPKRRAPRPATVDTVPAEHIAEASDSELLGLCLTAESWFRVFDSKNGQTLWLKVASYYPEHGSVGFTGFDAKKSLSMRTAPLIEDLVSGRAEPVNASPVQARAMTELRARHKKV